MNLELHLLGRPLILYEGEPVTDFVSDKALALFAYLALNDGWQARQKLAGLLWGEQTEKRARANLRHALHNLRQLFSDYVEVTRKRAAFVHDLPHWLDVDAFLELSGQTGNVEALARADSLYRDELLAGIAVDGEQEFEEWRRAERERLRLRWLQVLQHLAQQHAAQGCWRQAEQAIRRLLALEPWSESAHRQLMMLLARQGEYSAALAQYEQCRDVLRAELGVAPMPITRALQRRIRRLRRRPRHNLPARTLPLLGREREVDDLRKLLVGDDARLVTIVGLGGVGKTRLAVEVAAGQTAFFLDGIYWVSLSGVKEAGYLAGHMVMELGVERVADQEPRNRLLEFLGGKEMLLVLDNFEQLLEGVGLLQEILQAAPAVKILVTSRERLKLQAEYLYPLSGLHFSRWTTPAEAEQDPAVQLFLNYARRVRPSFSLRNEHLQAVRAILERVEGMPLAVILAAGWTEVLGPKEIAAELSENLDFLEGTFADVLPRQRSMRAVFAATWARLSRREQTRFAAISVFRGNITLEAARAVANATLRDLLHLTGRSLLTRVGEGRFEVHELLRQFGEERLEESPAVAAVRDAHAAYYLQTLVDYLPDLKGRDQLGAVQAIETDFENVRAAWGWACKHGQWEKIAPATESLYLFAVFRRRQLDGIALLDMACAALDKNPAGDERLARVYVLSSRHALNYMGLREEALAAIPTLEGLIESVNVPSAIAYCHLMLGHVLHQAVRYAQAAEALEVALPYYEQAPEPLYAALCLRRLGLTHLRRGQLEQGIALDHRGLAFARQSGDRFISGGLLRDLGILTWNLAGATAEAERYYREASNLWRELGVQSYARSLAYVAKVAIWRGSGLDKARRLLEEALAVTEEQNVRAVRLYVLDVVYTLLLIEGRYEEVLSLAEKGLALAVDQEGDWAWASVQRGIAFLALGDVDRATHCIRRGLEPMLKWPAGPFLLTALAFAGVLLAERGQQERAVEVIALALAKHPGENWVEHHPLIGGCRADLEVALGQKRFAALWERGEGMDVKANLAQVLEALAFAG